MVDDKLLDILACPACVRNVVVLEIEPQSYGTLIAEEGAFLEKAVALNREHRFSGHKIECRGGQTFSLHQRRTHLLARPDGETQEVVIGQVKCADCANVFTILPTFILPPKKEPDAQPWPPQFRLIELREGMLWCLNPECRKRYPIRDGIPVMLIDEALDPDEEPPAEAGSQE